MHGKGKSSVSGNEAQALTLLRTIVESCDVLELPGGCTLETVPKIHMDAAREWFGVAEPTPQKLTDVFNLTQEDKS